MLWAQVFVPWCFRKLLNFYTLFVSVWDWCNTFTTSFKEEDGIARLYQEKNNRVRLVKYSLYLCKCAFQIISARGAHGINSYAYQILHCPLPHSFCYHWLILYFNFIREMSPIICLTPIFFFFFSLLIVPILPLNLVNIPSFWSSFALKAAGARAWAWRYQFLAAAAIKASCSRQQMQM